MVGSCQIRQAPRSARAGAPAKEWHAVTQAQAPVDGCATLRDSLAQLLRPDASRSTLLRFSPPQQDCAESQENNRARFGNKIRERDERRAESAAVLVIEVVKCR